MNTAARKSIALLALLILALSTWACAGKKKNQDEHFGTSVNWPTFQGAGDFFHRFNEVQKILVFKKLDGKPVDMDWIDPAFREKLCLTLTINNHCVG